MRVLFAVSPGLDHLFPTVGLAWAFRTAGHEVAIATSGTSVDAAVRTGLPVWDVSPGADFDAIFPLVGTVEERAKRMRERGRTVAQAGVTPDIILEKFGRVSDLMADGTLAFARAWQPELIVYSRLQGAALLVARALGVPAVEHGFSFLREGSMPQRFLPHLAPVYERLGVPVELPDVTSLYFAPEHLMYGEGTGWTMRSVPYHGGGAIPGWLVEPRQRPRICVTLGTTVPHVAGVGSLGRVLQAAGDLDAEFVLALGDDPHLAPLGRLPDNCRVVDWTPLSLLLANCDAIVHHGGAGTTLASAHAGVPQLAMPHGADNWINADIVTRCGVGLNREPEEMTVDDLHALLGDPTIRKAAGALAAELAAEPGPDQLVPRLVGLAETATRVRG
ncbi:UDP:flavonoid glycosyltransferase YjiC (YdhE family) [Krasilnikovia cinnamomea]|uniref:UDP:flavonoid glycosyltransferase YjiC (YdhE family) n=1 Tax=Krasilnikovia cinnamomea TaxID=349313 RepID=A0A4Q7ZKY7_9ACTN|nr:nucleotide disphospho-sugar-binding domain-containing protein [Krasilnikovia cinnamomea]RZU51612.1 UDP:flavonoid glycosyltransferase YjiC (YdhE family) [Krasilnikovia cinnamomea]